MGSICDEMEYDDNDLLRHPSFDADDDRNDNDVDRKDNGNKGNFLLKNDFN